MGMTLSEEQEREDRAMSSCTLVSGQSASLWFALNRSHAEIDALRERVKTLEGALEQACDFLESENLGAEHLRAPLKQ